MNDDEFDPAPVIEKLSELDKPQGLVPVVSNERLIGHALSNGFDREMLAYRIREIFPNAKILVTVREQDSMIMSNYMQYLKYGGWHTPEKFLHLDTDTRQPVLKMNYWDYNHVADLYHKVFGAENVLILPHEILRQDPAAYVHEIAQFSGTSPPNDIDATMEINPRRQHVSSYYLRRLTYLRRKTAANANAPPIFGERLDRLFEKMAKASVNLVTPAGLEKRVEQSLSNRISHEIGDFFVASNRELLAKTTFDLTDLGYRTIEQSECLKENSSACN